LKQTGKEVVVASPEESVGKVFDLMDALKASIEKQQENNAGTEVSSGKRLIKERCLKRLKKTTIRIYREICPDIKLSRTFLSDLIVYSNFGTVGIKPACVKTQRHGSPQKRSCFNMLIKKQIVTPPPPAQPGVFVLQ